MERENRIAELEKWSKKQDFFIDKLGIQIAELEKENAELKKTATGALDLCKNLNARCAELEKENAELKEILLSVKQTKK